MGQDAGQSEEAKRDVAVALTYDGDDNEPRVVASGHGLMARQIVALAFENGIRVREDADLAGILAAVDMDSALPSAAVMAVAEILSYLYRSNRDLRDGGWDGHVARES